LKDKEFKVSGYSFTDSYLYKEAKREEETINYIRANTDLNDINKTLKLYHKLVERKTLKTIVGYSFLKELQEKILKEGIVSKESLPCIKFEPEVKHYQAYLNQQEKAKEEKKRSLAEDYRIRHRNSRIINIFLVIIIVVMFLITIFSDRNKFTDYENQILNKYSAWEEQLNERQKALDEREASQLQD
jgi:hypothetical protein